MEINRSSNMNVALTSCFLTVFAILATGCGNSDDAGIVLSPPQLEESLDFIEETLRSAHYGSLDSLSDEARELLESVRIRAKSPMSEETFYFAVNSFLTPLNDAHTVARWRKDVVSTLDHIDLPIQWNENGMLVVSATDRLQPGDRINRIGKHDEAAILERLRPVIPSENAAYLIGLAGNLLSRGNYLRFLNAVESDNTVVLEVVSPDGAIRIERLSLHDRNPEGDEATWFGFEIFPNKSLGLFWIDRLEYNQELADAIESFFKEIDANDIEKIAVDLRGNPGGDSLVAFAFLEHFADFSYESFSVDIRVSKELDRKSPQFSIAAMNQVFQSVGMDLLPDDTTHYRVPGELVKQIMLGRLTTIPPQSMTVVEARSLFLVTDALTFSSSSLFATLVRDNKIGTIVGEPTGNRVNFYGSELRFDIPHTRMYLNLSTAQMIRPDSSLGDELTIEPDIYLPFSVDSVVEDKDPSLQYLKGL